MRLENYQIEIKVIKDENCFARVETNVKRNIATIEFNIVLLSKYNEQELIDTIFHELLHIHKQEEQDFVYQLIEKLDSKASAEIIREFYTTMDEKYTDTLARILTALYQGDHK